MSYRMVEARHVGHRTTCLNVRPALGLTDPAQGCLQLAPHKPAFPTPHACRHNLFCRFPP